MAEESRAQKREGGARTMRDERKIRPYGAQKWRKCARTMRDKGRKYAHMVHRKKRARVTIGTKGSLYPIPKKRLRANDKQWPNWVVIRQCYNGNAVGQWGNVEDVLPSPHCTIYRSYCFYRFPFYRHFTILPICRVMFSPYYHFTTLYRFTNSHFTISPYSHFT